MQAWEIVLISLSVIAISLGIVIAVIWSRYKELLLEEESDSA